MKLSHGLKLILNPLLSLTPNPLNLFETMRKLGKRGKDATLYPTDFRKVNVILETWHEVTGKHFFVEVQGENIQNAIASLSNWIKEEDYLLDRIAA